MVSHIMRENGKIKSWNNLKNEFKLEQRLYFRWIQHSRNLKHKNNYSKNLIILDHLLVKFNSLFNIEMLELREFCFTQ